MKKLQILSRFFFPEKCPACGRILKFNEELCLCCGEDRTKLSVNCCEGCGKEKDMCTCNTPYTCSLSHITGVYAYDGAVRNMLLSYKFSSRKEFYRRFGDAVAERAAIVWADVDFDTVTFVPSSPESVKERGYNSSYLIAGRAAEKLFLPCEELIIKSKETEKQHRLTAKERTTNIKGSIAPKENALIKGRTVLLCDDIKTTGATLAECCNVLFEQGAKDVYCVTVAVT